MRLAVFMPAAMSQPLRAVHIEAGMPHVEAA